MIYKDRQEAGHKLAEKLTKHMDEKPIIIALPRGGVVLGYEVAKALKAPLDVLVTRKLGAPFQPEFGIGAIAPNGIKFLDHKSIKLLGFSDNDIEDLIEKESIELHRRIDLYRQDLPPLDLNQKTVIMVDDGLATGVTAMAAVLSVKEMNPKKIILAVPVSPPETAEKFRKIVDDFVCFSEPYNFYAVGAYYEDFEPVSDAEVIELLNQAKKFSI